MSHNLSFQGRSVASRPLGRLKSDRATDRPLILPSEYAVRHVLSIKNSMSETKKLALLISGYNEELVIAHTIQSAMRAGMDASDIYIVDDCSSDSTSRIARTIVGNYNVLRVPRSGKGLALKRAARDMQLTKRYQWIHIADADGEFDEEYFRNLLGSLEPENAAATGYVTSLPGSIIGQYRVFEYALGMEIVRRFQNIAGTISIIPGPTSVFRSDVFDQLEFSGNALCEDFDVTLQLHRKKLGSIQFIPEAVARTQDPANFKDYIRQITRWNRGVMQMIFKHKIGRRATKLDSYLMYQVMQNLLFAFTYIFWVPYMTITTMNPAFLALSFLTDIIMTFGFVMFAAHRTKRWDILSAFPIIYALRWVSLLVFVKSFIEVAILRKYRVSDGHWETVERTRQTA
jgi:cellulose synthase/poly-beta-1,6-N-acetylglucosamine synthase-like glycosyltransferase